MTRVKKYNSADVAGFTQRLQAALNGRNKAQFARDIGVSYESVRRWCNGQTLPDGGDLITIARVLNISLDWLLLGRKVLNPAQPRDTGVREH